MTRQTQVETELATHNIPGIKTSVTEVEHHLSSHDDDFKRLKEYVNPHAITKSIKEQLPSILVTHPDLLHDKAEEAINHLLDPVRDEHVSSIKDRISDDVTSSKHTIAHATAVASTDFAATLHEAKQSLTSVVTAATLEMTTSTTNATTYLETYLHDASDKGFTGLATKRITTLLTDPQQSYVDSALASAVTSVEQLIDDKLAATTTALKESITELELKLATVTDASQSAANQHDVRTDWQRDNPSAQSEWHHDYHSPLPFSRPPVRNSAADGSGHSSPLVGFANSTRALPRQGVANSTRSRYPSPSTVMAKPPAALQDYYMAEVDIADANQFIISLNMMPSISVLDSICHTQHLILSQWCSSSRTGPICKNLLNYDSFDALVDTKPTSVLAFDDELQTRAQYYLVGLTPFNAINTKFLIYGLCIPGVG